MILRMLAVSVIAAVAAGCSSLDGSTAELDGWTEDRLAGQAAGTPPVYVPERVLERSTLASMSAAERALVVRGAQVREAAASVPDPQESADDYAVRQRAIATPPE